MLNSVLSKAVLDRLRPTAIAAVLVVAYGAIAIVAYNAMGATLVDLIASMPPALASMYGANDGTPVGMAIGAIYSIIAPAVVLTYAIGGGTGAAVGEERKGSLDLLLANPISRTSVALSKFVVVVGGVLVIGLGTWIAVISAAAFAEGGLGDRNVLALTVMLIGFGLMAGSFAMAISGWTGKGRLGSGVTAAVVVASWFVTTILSVNDSFAPVAGYTPWRLYDGNDPMINGVDPVALGIMAVASVGLVYIGVAGINRRDLRG
jgi:ABC-2 type transport system permease protein